MAEPVVSFVVEKLCNLLLEEAIFLHGVHDQVQLLEMELRQMRTFLRAAESKPSEDSNIANFLEEVREAAYDAEDIVDTYILRMHKQRRRQGLIKSNILRESARRHNVGMQIEGIKTRLQRISEMRSRYGIHDVTGGTQERVSEVDMIMQQQRALAIRREMNVMVGFDDEMDKIVRTLLSINEKPQRCVVSIVGMGGAGKSTLARRVCSREDVIRSFDGCALVTVSQTLNQRKIFEDIAVNFSGLGREAIQKMDEGDLKDNVFKSLHDKRYLIVLDDIWKIQVWSLIGPHLPDEKNGSRVIITTRSMDVAKFADPSMEPHQLRLLREDESWELFTKIVFPGHDTNAEDVCTGELKQMGKKILKSCGGLPLAIVLMAGLLSTKEKSPIVWDDSVKGINWEGVPGGQVFSKVLALSYRDLPHHLKLCFLYLSLFPEDFDIEADRLVQLWVAEGFVPDQADGQCRNQHDRRTMEETAEGWLEDLIRRCLVQVVKGFDLLGLSSTMCRMHDVLRDLSIKEAEKVNFFRTWQQQVANISPPPTTIRRLVYNNLQEGTGDEYVFDEFRAPKLRTFLGIGLVAELQFLLSSKLLRVLDLRYSYCHELPKEIGDLIHLRYLGLRTCFLLESIPSSVGNLQNLQTLDLMLTHVKEVPDNVWGIRMLRHVFFGNKIEPRINVVCASSGLLPVNLQTLYGVRAGSWIESSLATLTRLRRLGIWDISQAHLQAVSNSLDSLVHLRQLILSAAHGDQRLLPRKALALPNHRRLQVLALKGRLVLSIDDRGLIDDGFNDNHPAYESNEMPPNLTELHLHGSRLQQDPFLLLEKLPYLRRLVLSDAYEGEEAMCSAGGFPQLEELELKFERSLRQWKVGDGALHRLRRLEIRSCNQLEMLPSRLRHLKTLQTLETERMPNEFMRRLREDVGGDGCHQIQYIPRDRDRKIRKARRSRCWFWILIILAPVFLRWLCNLQVSPWTKHR